MEYYSTYLHCNTTWLVKAGDVVSKGQVVGYSGASSNGYAHLHFEIRRGGRTQRDSVNPWSWLPYPDTADGHTVEILSVVSTPVAAPAAAAPAAAPPRRRRRRRCDRVVCWARDVQRDRARRRTQG